MKKFLLITTVLFSQLLIAQTPWQYYNLSCVDPYEICISASPDGGNTYFPSFRYRDTTAFQVYADTFMLSRLYSTYNDGAPNCLVHSTNNGQIRRTAITGTPANGDAITWDAVNGQLKYASASVSALPSMSGQSGKYLTNNGTTASWESLPGATRFTAYSAGTAYNLTTSSARVDFGTTDPSITITTPGTYMIMSNLKIEYAGLTNVLVNPCTFKLRRTNNTAADLSNASTTFNVPVVTLLTQTGGDADIAPVFYTTTNSNDVIEMFGNRTNSITVGNIQVGEASIVALRIM